MTKFMLSVGSAFAATPAWAAQAQQGGYGQHMWGGGWHGGGFFGPIAMFLALAATIAVVVLAVRWLAPGRYGHADISAPTAGSTPAPLDILKERFAKGEIDKKEFEERRKVLQD